MAKGRKSRMDLRREAEAVEARKRDEETDAEETEEGDEEEDEEDDSDAEIEIDLDADADAEGDAEGDEDGGDEDDEDRPKKKKGKKVAKKAAPKKAATKRTRTPKEVRTRAVWVVFDNASKVVKEFPYSEKAAAEALLAEKLEEKKTFYLNLVKQEIKDKE